MVVAVPWKADFDHIKPWLKTLSQDDYDLVMAAIEVLKDLGPGLGRPLVDTVTASKYKNMKELRPGSTGRTEVRILFAFDPKRQAIMLIAGDKTGQWGKWYAKNIPLADALFAEHIRSIKNEH